MSNGKLTQSHQNLCHSLHLNKSGIFCFHCHNLISVERNAGHVNDVLLKFINLHLFHNSSACGSHARLGTIRVRPRSVLSQPQVITFIHRLTPGLDKTEYMDPCGNVGDAVHTLRPRKNGRHFTDDILKSIFVKENVWILIKVSLKFVRTSTINNIPALV